MIHDWIWKLRSVCYCYLNINFQYLNNITHFFTSYVFLRNNVSSTRNILLGLKWLKIAFHLEPSFSLVLMWMQHTRQIINRKVNRSQSIANTTYLSILCLLSLIYEVWTCRRILQPKKKKKNLLEKNKSQFWSFIKVQIGLWVSYSHSHHTLSLSLSLSHCVIANYRGNVQNSCVNELYIVS